MKERPILFSGPMVRAILEGRKTQTRRVVDFDRVGTTKDYQVERGCFGADGFDIIEFGGPQQRIIRKPWTADHIKAWLKCPYGQPGDRLWVRETWSQVPEYKPVPYPENCPKVYYRADNDRPTWAERPWRPSMFMYRWASRITLEIVSVRVERLQEISENDAKAEGVKAHLELNTDGWRTLVDDYKDLWESINSKSHPWDSNPFVWCIEFRRLQ